MITKIANITQLRTRKGDVNSFIETMGYSTSTDGGGNIFYWDATSIAADNTGTVIQVTGVNTGRWISINKQEVYLSWFENSNTGFQNFLNAAAGKTGIINRNATLTTTMNVPGDLTLRQNKGTLISTNANVGFLWNLKKNFLGTGLNWTSTATTTGSTLMKFDGMWNATFDTCVFDMTGGSNSSGVDIIQLLPGPYNTTELWGTYYCNFHNIKFAGGRYICKADGYTYPSFITNITFSFCWATNGVSFLKATRANNFNIHRICADSLSGHAFDLSYCSDFVLETNEIYTPPGFYTLNEDVNCNKNVVNLGTRVNDFTVPVTNDMLGWDGSKLTLQGSNSNADNFRTRLNSIFSYAGSTILQGKGGTNVWTDIVKWSETIGTIIKAGWNNWIRLRENKISIGVNDQIKTFVKTMTATSGQYQDLIYFNTYGANQTISAEVTIYYRSNDSTISAIQKANYVQVSNASEVVSLNFEVTHELIVGTTVLPTLNTFYSGSTSTAAITHTNISSAATMDIVVKYSGTTNATVA